MDNFLKKIIITFVTLTFFLILIIIYFSYSKAIIIIAPILKKVSTDFTIQAKETVDFQNPNMLPTIFSETFEEEQGAFLVKETDAKTEIPSTGKVIIFNETSANHYLIATTRLLSQDGILCRLKKNVSIPANGKIEIEIYANKLEKEIPKETLFAIPGLSKQMQDKIYAKSSESITKNTQKIKIVTEEIIENSSNTLKEKILKRIQKRINESLATNEKNTSIPSLFTSEIVEIIKDAKIGEQKDIINLKIKCKITAINFDKEKLFQIAKNKLSLKISSSQKLINPLQNFIYSIEQYNSKIKEATIKIHIEGMSVLDSEAEILNKNKLIDLTKKELEEYLSQFNEIQKTEIKFSPFWTIKTPKIKNHIEIIIQ
mgnify:FL=1